MITEKNHSLNLIERSKMSVGGVSKVVSFSDKEIVLITVMGKLTVKGENLHIETLNVETGEFLSTGKVSSMVYSKCSVNKGSFIERVFR